MLRRKGSRITKLIFSSCIPKASVSSVLENQACRAFSSALGNSSLFEDRQPSRQNFSHTDPLHWRPPSRGFAVLAEEDGKPTEQLRDDTLQTPLLPDDGGSNFFGSDATGPDAITNAAELASLGEAWDNAWYINKGFQLLIQNMHESTGTPWWSAIALATVVCRFCMLPLVLKQMKNLSNMQRAKPEMEQLNAWFAQKKEMGQGETYQYEMMERMSGLWKKYNCHPLKSMIPILGQAPIFIGFFGALRSMAEAKIPSMTVEGLPLLWYQDLTVADPYYTLPILSSLIFLLSIELNLTDGMEAQSGVAQSRTKWLMRFIAVIIVPFAGSMPQSVFCYWITSNMFTLVQGAVLRTQRVKQALGIPAPAIANQGKAMSASMLAAATSGQPIQTFTHPPTKPLAQTSRQKRAAASLKAQSLAAKSQGRS